MVTEAIMDQTGKLISITTRGCDSSEATLYDIL